MTSPEAIAEAAMQAIGLERGQDEAAFQTLVEIAADVLAELDEPERWFASGEDRDRTLLHEARLKRMGERK